MQIGHAMLMIEGVQKVGVSILVIHWNLGVQESTRLCADPPQRPSFVHWL